MKRIIIFLVSVLFVTQSYADSRWGKDYFPNVTLINQDGKESKFYDDLIKDKIVVINFIYTTCPDVCPLETAQLTRVQRILGDRLGKDVHFYSISITPDTDTPKVLSEYRNRFGAKWDFFTGNEEEIITIRRKLGLYIEDIGGSENNHNVNMIMGNQKTGRWMKRSPFENPYVLADQIGNWLDGWKSPQEVKDYAKAPEINEFSDGENLFRTRCMSCHTIDGSSHSIGPDLLDVTKRRDRKWLVRWLKEPDVMIAEKDPLAIALYNQYNKVSMPNFSLTEVDIMDLFKYLRDTSDKRHRQVKPEKTIVSKDAPLLIVKSWVREAVPGSRVHAAYMTLVNLHDEDIVIDSISCKNYSSIEVHEMSMENGNMSMREIENLEIKANSNVKLKPGGMHLMLFDPEKDNYAGDKLDFEFVFTNGKKQLVTVPVKNM